MAIMKGDSFSSSAAAVLRIFVWFRQSVVRKYLQ